MIIWRVIGWILCLAGLFVLAIDAHAWFDTKVWMPTALGQLWYELDRSSLNLVQAVIQRYISPFLWDRIIVNILLCWAFAVLIGLGALILLVARKRAMEVTLRNRTTGEIKRQKIGWSWTCFLFSPALGIPLFIRKLHVWGGIMVALWIVNLLASSIYVSIVILIVQLAFSIAFGISGNSMAGKNYLEHGWEFAEPDSEGVARARTRWKLGLPQPQPLSN